MSNSPWQLSGDTATLAAWRARLDLARPAAGLGGWPVPSSRVLGVRPAVDGACFPLVDAYVRGADVVARYGACDRFPFRTEVYWRASGADQRTPGLQVIVSVETDLLDTYPVLQVASRLETPAESIASVAGAPQAVLPDGRLWCEAVHPNDLPEASHAWGLDESGPVSRWRLFDRFLEKGVIRRALLACVVLPAGDPGAASTWRGAFATQPAPLTA